MCKGNANQSLNIDFMNELQGSRDESKAAIKI